MKSILKIAAVIFVAMLIGSLLYWPGRNSGNMAFGDVLEHIRAVQSVAFKMRTTVTPPGQKAQENVAEVIIAEPGRMRQTMHTPEGDAISVWDLKAKKALTLMAAQKKAMLMSIENFDDSKMPGSMNLLADLKKKDHKDFKPDGEKVLNGRATETFTGGKEGQSMYIWVDRQTQLPVQIEITMQSPMFQAISLLMTDFAWDVPVDEKQFSLTPPDGYELTNMSMDYSQPTERDLLNTLGVLAELSGGKFPDTFDHMTLPTLIQKLDREIPKDRNIPMDKALKDRLIKSMQTIGRGYMFVGEPGNGELWHYAGKGVNLGQAGTPIFWYRAKGAKTYRVIDADLKVREVQELDLPKVPAIPVKNPIAEMAAPASRSGETPKAQ
ncbi:MAG: DUF2092 domain-containing protein [Planctomycetota bacterium]|nr:DUF2092 domain-containing protein [Planctomycetota bacterium]